MKSARIISDIDSRSLHWTAFLFLEDTGERPADASNRIPVRYRFNKAKNDQMKSKGFRLEF